jgi:putative ABC transport system permease protein
MISDFLKMSLQSIWHRKLRSFLTLLGILIAVATLFILVSLSLGLENAVQEQFRQLGTDKFFVQPKGQAGAPGAGGAVELTINDIDVLEKVSGIKKITWYTAATVEISQNDEKRYTMAIGFEMDNIDMLMESSNYKIEEGKMLRKGEKGYVILGSQYKTADFLSKPLKVGDKLLLNGKEFKIKGFFASVGNPTDDRLIYFEESEFRQFFNIPDRIDAVIVQTEQGADVKEVAERAEKKLRTSRGVTEKTQDFIILTPEEVLSIFNTILSIMTGFLLSIAAISLIVGAIGIATTTFTSVLERTREIGVMKAIGAKNSDILWIFTIESGLLGLFGGILGVVLGVIVAKTIEYIAINQLGTNLLQAATPTYLIIGCLAFAFFIGAFSGLWPARNASKIKPVDALRYE